jgi:hypothetical protein
MVKESVRTCMIAEREEADRRESTELANLPREPLHPVNSFG